MLFQINSLHLPILGLLLLLSWPARAQPKERSNKENTKSTYNVSSIQNSYHYSSFEPGTVTFYDSSRVTAQLNYNWLLREMQFTNEEGDTLALAKGEGISTIRFQEELFHFVPPYGFLAFIRNHKTLRLYIHYSMVERVVGTGSLSRTVMVTKSEDSTGKTQVNSMRGRTIIIPTKYYFLVDKNNTAYEVTKSTLLKLYPNHRREINQYLRKNTNSLNNTKELTALLQYIDQLSVL